MEYAKNKAMSAKNAIIEELKGQELVKEERPEMQKKQDEHSSKDEVSLHEFLDLANRYIEKDNMCDFSLEYKDMKISFSTAQKGNYSMPMPNMFYGAPGPVGTHEGTASSDSKSKAEDYKEVKSNMVGTLYTASSPTEEPYIKVGSEVKEGQTIFIIEAMKVMTHFKSPYSGIVKEILVHNEETVEYGKVLVRIT